MERIRLDFEVVSSPKESKTNVIMIKTITTDDGMRYDLTSEFGGMENHEAIRKTKTWEKVKISLKKRHDKLNVWFLMTQELEEFYLDEAGNFEVSGQILNGRKEQEQSELGEKSDRGEGRNLKNISDKFIIEKFTSKDSNAKQWLETFEKECSRFEIKQDGEKIDVLRLFLDRSVQNWYNSMMIREEDEKIWVIWRRKFIDTFGSRGWQSRAYAHNYKFIEGSLLDYAIKKERLLLEINRHMDMDTLIDRIGFGLPENIRERINRDELKETADLFNEVRKYEGKIEKGNNYKAKESKVDFKRKNEEKKPCRHCEKLNKGIRYHPEEKCWFKINEYGKTRSTAFNSNTILDVELETEEKNV